MKTFATLLCTLALLPIGAAQFDTGGGSTASDQPWKSFKLNSKTHLKLDFRNANADMVLALYQKTSGITIVKDPALTGGLTLTSAKPVSLNDAFEILNAVLSLKNFDLRKEGNLLVIRKRPDANAGGRGANPFMTGTGDQAGGMGDTTGGRGGARDTVLRVYAIKFANATEVARVLNDVFAPANQQANNPFMFGGGGRRFAMNVQQQGNQQQNQNQGPMVRASSDDFSNSVIVNAPLSQQTQVKELIDKIDKQTDEPQQSRVFKLQYAVAQDLAPVVQNVLVSNAPRGKGGASNQTIDFQSRFQQALRFGSTQAAFGQVAVDSRMNALVITATPENLDTIGKVIDQLDKSVTVQPSTFVFPLNNARADQVATLMNQAFGSRSGTNPQLNQFGQARTPNQTGTTNRSTSTNRPPQLSGQVVPGDQTVAQNNDKQLELALQDPSANAGDLLTSIGVQGGFLGGMLNQRPGQSSAPTNSRDDQGRLVNIRDLVGQVTIIPDINTNSLIVVGGPDVAQIVKSILDQLDKIPEQVMIETMIVEATLDSSDKLGVEWSLVQPRAFGTQGATGTATQTFGLQSSTTSPTGFKYTLSSGNLTAFINALKTDTKFQVLSTPRIFTSNNVQASINISQSIPYVLSSTTDAATGVQSFNYAFQDVGIILTVTPRITANGYVTMDVTQTANDLQGFTSFNAPIVNQRQANTTVSVRDGETIILGGIIRNTVSTTTNKIPLLGDIPILGKLFQSSDKSKQKTELLVFLTPKVVTGPETARELRDKTVREMSKENQENVKHLVPPVKPNVPDTGKG